MKVTKEIIKAIRICCGLDSNLETKIPVFEDGGFTFEGQMVCEFVEANYKNIFGADNYEKRFSEGYPSKKTSLWHQHIGSIGALVCCGMEHEFN